MPVRTANRRLGILIDGLTGVNRFLIISAAAGAHIPTADWVSPVSRTQAAQVCQPINSKSVKRELLRFDHFGN